MKYTYLDIVQAYESLGLQSGDTVYVLSALWQMVGYEEDGFEVLTAAHLRALQDVVGPQGTIVVSTSSMNLCNTDIPFDLEQTPSVNVGLFSELVRLSPGAKRSFHPFGSYAALGAKAEEITENTSCHVFGPHTPEARMIEGRAKVVAVGIPINICSTAHHVEMMMCVPYRYTKEFQHPVIRDGSVQVEPFYLHVMYRDIGVERSHNKRLFAAIGDKLKYAEVALGRGHMYSYVMSDFVDEATKVFADDIYIWCKKPPSIRPYTV